MSNKIRVCLAPTSGATRIVAFVSQTSYNWLMSASRPYDSFVCSAYFDGNKDPAVHIPYKKIKELARRLSLCGKYVNPEGNKLNVVLNERTWAVEYELQAFGHHKFSGSGDYDKINALLSSGMWRKV